MATVISKEDFDAHPAEVRERAMAGEEIAIEQEGGVRLKLMRVTPEQPGRRTFGALKGRLSVPATAFDPLPEEELRAWEGG